MTICSGNFSLAETKAVTAWEDAADTHLPRAFIVPIADTVAAVMFDTGDPGGSGGRALRRLSVQLDGVPMAGPLLSSCLDLRAGGKRHVLLLRRSAESLADCHLKLSLGGQAVAAIDPSWLQPPVVDSLSLIDGLSERGQRRLLKLFLTTGASMFGLDVSSDLGAALRTLLDQLGVTAAEFVCTVPIGKAGRILSFRVPAHWGDPQITELVAQQSARLSRVARFELHLETSPGGGLCHVFLPGAEHRGSALIGLGDKPVLLPAPDADAAGKPLVSWLARRGEATARWARGLVDAAAQEDSVAAAMRRELQPGAEAELSVRHLSRTPTGLLYAFEVRDTRDLVRAVRFEIGAEHTDVTLCDGAQRTSAAQRVAGYAGFPQADAHEEVCVRLVHHSGRVRLVETLSPPAFDGCVPDGLRGCGADQAALSVAQARRAMARRVPAMTRTAIGAQPDNPRISLVAAVGSNLDIIRARTAMLARERGAARVESIYHLADGESAGAARRVIEDAHEVFGLPFTIVTVAADATPAERLRAALSSARADAALVLGADVLPQGAGWLPVWLRALGRADAPQVLGGTLLAAGAVANAGGMAGPANPAARERRLVGVPERDLPGVATLATCFASAECAGLRREAIDLLCSSASVYPNPDIILAEIIAALRGEGGRARTYLRGRFDRYRDDGEADAVDALADRYALAAIYGEGRE